MMKNYKKREKNIKALLLMCMALLFFSNTIFGQTITYTFANAQIVNDGMNDFYEVDVLMESTSSFQLGPGSLYFTYNTAAFGTNIQGSGGLTISAPSGSITDDGLTAAAAAKVYSIQTPVDNDTFRFNVTWLQSFAAHTFASPNIAADTPRVVFRIRMQYTDVSQNPTIAFDGTGSFDDQTFTSCGPASGANPFEASDCAGNPGTNITDDTFDSSGSKLVNNWTGTTNTDWDTSTNWSFGVTPESFMDVTISNVTNDPMASGAISVDGMTLNSGASLTVNGAITNSSAIVINSGGSLIAQTSVSGNITYNRNLGTNNWYLVSAPVSGETIQDLISNHTFAAGSGGGRIGIAPYLNDGTGWDYQTSGSTGALIAGKGYSVKLDATGDISFTGTMPVSDVAIEITDGTANEFNLVGNPYPSFIALNDLADGTNNLLRANGTNGGNNDGNVVLDEDTVWFWDQSLNGGAGAYSQANLASSRFVAPGQGFFVKRTTAGGTLNFNFRENMQSHQTDNFQRNANTRPEIKLSITNGVEIKETDIFFIAGATTGWDNGYDSTVFGGADHSFSIYTQLVSDNENQDLGIQSLPDTGYETMIIPVGVNANAGTDITISATSLNLPNGIQVYLEDKEDNTFTLLDASSDFTTTLTEDEQGIGRFYVHTTASALGTGSFTLENVSIFLSANDNLRIVGVQSGDAKIEIYDILGKKVLATAFTGNGVNDVELPSLKSSVYIVKMMTQKGRLNKKIVIE